MKHILKKSLAFILLFIFVSSFTAIKAYSSTTGDILTNPEPNWKRIDCCNNTNIEYGSEFYNLNNSGFYHNLTDKSYIKFYFYGTKIKIIDDLCTNRKQGAKISIDSNAPENISSYSEEFIHLGTSYEKGNLEKKLHSVDIEIPYEEQKYFTMFYIDLDKDGYLTKVKNSLELNEHEFNLTADEHHSLTATVGGTIYKNSDVKWKTSNDKIASVDDSGNVTAHKGGEALITASIDNEDLADTCKITVNDKPVLNIETERNSFILNEEVNASLVIDNIQNIVAEDVRITYDSGKLKFLGMNETEGIKIVQSQEKEGEIRIILASRGKENIVNAKKTLLNLKFKALGTGTALIDVVKGTITDGITSEDALNKDQCGQATINIEDYKDINKDGKFSLLDLGIDARHYGENPSNFPQYKTDIVENGAIDDSDLSEIGKQMIADSKYNF